MSVTRGFIEFIQQKKLFALNCVEVGVCSGDHAVGMLENLLIDRLYLVDDYPEYQDISSFINKQKQEETYKTMIDNIGEYLAKIVLITKPSVFASTLFLDANFDYVYIDCDHSYENVRQDLCAWYPKVKKEGYLAGHDYDEHHKEGVVKAVDEFALKHNLKVLTLRGTDWVLIK